MDQLLIFLQEYWIILSTIIGFLISFAVLKSQNVDQERRIRCIEADQSTIRISQQSIDTKLAQIQNDLEWIKLSIQGKK